MAERTACRDCGSGSLGWWRSRGDGYRKAGSAHCRCEPCYLSYCRDRYRGRHPDASQRGPRGLTKVHEPSPKHAIACVICGVEVMTHMPFTKYCSQRCRNLRPGRQPPKPPRVPIPKVIASRVRFCSCRLCGRCMVERLGRKYCSDACRVTKIASSVMGLYGAAIGVRNLSQAKHWHRTLCRYLVVRDGAGCGICQAVVDIDLRSGPRGDDRGPSIDHIVPRSKGGSDDLANLRLTHWACNRNRGNRGDVEQLRLVG